MAERSAPVGTASSNRKEVCLTTDRTLPVAEELTDLPFFALLVLGARCARRAEPLFLEYWTAAPPQHVEAVRHAIQAVENLAAGPAASLWNDAARETSRAAGAAIAADLAEAPEPAVHAADAAAELAEAVHPERSRIRAARAAVRAAQAAAKAIGASGAENERGFFLALHEDLQTLRVQAGSQQWTDETAVSPRILDSQ